MIILHRFVTGPSASPSVLKGAYGTELHQPEQSDMDENGTDCPTEAG